MVEFVIATFPERQQVQPAGWIPGASRWLNAF